MPLGLGSLGPHVAGHCFLLASDYSELSVLNKFNLLHPFQNEADSTHIEAEVLTGLVSGPYRYVQWKNNF